MSTPTSTSGRAATPTISIPAQTSSSTAQSSTSSNSGSNLSTGGLVGIIFAAVVVTAIVIVIAVVVTKPKMRARGSQTSEDKIPLFSIHNYAEGGKAMAHGGEGHGGNVQGSS